MTVTEQIISILYFILRLSVAVSKLQVAILARSSREMSQTVRIDWKHFARVRVSVRPRYFLIREKQTKAIANTESPAQSPERLFTWMNKRRRSCGHGWVPPTHQTHCNHSSEPKRWKTTIQNESLYLHARWRLTWQITHMSATSQNGHNDSLFLQGLKSVV